MNAAERSRLRAAILRVCQAESKTMREILNAPGVAPLVGRFGPRIVKEATYALANTGLLFRGGDNLGSVYRTTPLGSAAIPMYDDLGS